MVVAFFLDISSYSPRNGIVLLRYCKAGLKALSRRTRTRTKSIKPKNENQVEKQRADQELQTGKLLLVYEWRVKVPSVKVEFPLALVGFLIYSINTVVIVIQVRLGGFYSHQ